MFLITHLLKFSVRHPRLIITFAGAITVFALFFIPRIQLRLDGRSLIPSGLPEFAEGDVAASRFELRDLVLIGVGNEESGVYTPETLRRIARLSDGLSRVEGVVAESVVSISTVPRLALVDKSVDTGPLFRPADRLSAEDIQQLRREVVKRGYNGGALVSADGKGAAIIAKVEAAADRYRLLEDTRALIATESSGKDTILSQRFSPRAGRSWSGDGSRPRALDSCGYRGPGCNAGSFVSTCGARAFVTHGDRCEQEFVFRF